MSILSLNTSCQTADQSRRALGSFCNIPWLPSERTPESPPGFWAAARPLEGLYQVLLPKISPYKELSFILPVLSIVFLIHVIDIQNQRQVGRDWSKPSRHYPRAPWHCQYPVTSRSSSLAPEALAWSTHTLWREEAELKQPSLGQITSSSSNQSIRLYPASP